MKLHIKNVTGRTNDTKVYLIDDNNMRIDLPGVIKVDIDPIVGGELVTANILMYVKNVELDNVSLNQPLGPMKVGLDQDPTKLTVEDFIDGEAQKSKKKEREK